MGGTRPLPGAIFASLLLVVPLAAVASCASAVSTAGPASTAPAGRTAPVSTAPTVYPGAPPGTLAPSGSSAPPGAAAQGCAHRSITITNADNGKSLCVVTGTLVTVLLRGSGSEHWARIGSSSAALISHPNPALSLIFGSTGAGFVARSPGTAVIASTRYPCGSGGQFTQSPQCAPDGQFTVTVTVQPG